MPKFLLTFWVNKETELKTQKQEDIEKLHREMRQNNYDEEFIRSEIDFIKTNRRSNSLLKCRLWPGLFSSRAEKLIDDIKHEAEKESKRAPKRGSPLPSDTGPFRAILP